MIDYLAQTVIREKEFFELTGVQQRITTLGQDDKYSSFYDGSYAGWYYSIEDLKKLGVGNILVDAPVWEPAQTLDKAKVLKIKVDDI